VSGIRWACLVSLAVQTAGIFIVVLVCAGVPGDGEYSLIQPLHRYAV